jgi:hypothetical protein
MPPPTNSARVTEELQKPYSENTTFRQLTGTGCYERGDANPFQPSGPLSPARASNL